MTRLWLLLLFCAATAVGLPAQVFKIVANLDGYNGNTGASLVQGPDGSLYGTSPRGGNKEAGSVFKVTLDGTVTLLYSFCSEPGCSDGGGPGEPLLLATDGNFYGTTNGSGTLFKITPKGKLNTLLRFCSQTACTDGSQPYGGLTLGGDGNLYGTTSSGGTYGNYGTIFKITTEGKLETLHAFRGDDGYNPNSGLVQVVDGNFYGTTKDGGAEGCFGFGCGTVFKMAPSGKLTTLHKFNQNDGFSPNRLIQGSAGDLYGTTYEGGNNGHGKGTVFKIASDGSLTTLHTFEFTDGAFPTSGLVQGTDGNFYGTTTIGGPGNPACGTAYQITPEGALTLLHNFDCDDGKYSYAALMQATNGAFYGTTYAGGANDWGVVFSIDMGLKPFVRAIRSAGAVGQTDGILGQGFTGTTDVSINGAPAEFKVVSDTFLKATVPDGATSGFVSVTTPSGTLTSNKIFRVRPQLLSFDPPSGPVGTQVTITGVSLTQTQGVGFGNRVPAQFAVNSDTQVTAIVPSGAKTGKVGIETTGGTAISSETFTVTP
ncbi:MAG: hypothetical protein LAO09_06360 [Acidobacteriia bacterium]|nr:hypothetical protein [Terriglobia bacterium]